MWKWLKSPASKSSGTPSPAVGHARLQRKCACGQHTNGRVECEDCKEKNKSSVQRHASSGSGSASVPPIVNEVLRSPGQPLDPGTRAFFEPRFQQDFSQVRIHADQKAIDSTKAVSAHAYTFGNQIVFGPNQLQPETESGRRLMAHELSHVIQQRGAQAAAGSPARISNPAEQSEKQAEEAGDQVMRQAAPSLFSAAPEDVLQRDAADPKSGGKQASDKGKVEVRLAFEGKCPHPEKIAEAIPGARTMLTTAEHWFINYPFLDVAQQQFFDSILLAHFGSNSSAVRGRVHSRIIRMARIMDAAVNGGVVFDCGSGKPDKCNEGPYSMFVRRKERNVIHVCPDYFKAGLDERRFLLIHESAHMAGVLVDHYLVQAGPIGRAECLAASGLSSAEALNNADSYAWAVMCLTRKDPFTLIPGMNIRGKKP